MVLCQRGREEKGKEEKEEAPEDFFWSSSSTSSWCTVTAMWAWVPLSLFVVWSSLDIMAGTYQKYSYVLLMCKVGFPWLFCTSRGVSFPVFRPEMLGIRAGMD